MAIPKGDRLEWLVQKVTELGVDRLALLHAERSVVRWKPDRVQSQLVRLRRIADEACRQSRRVWRVDDRRARRRIDRARRLRRWPSRVGVDSSPRDRSVAIGPEGGLVAR